MRFRLYGVISLVFLTLIMSCNDTFDEHDDGIVFDDDCTKIDSATYEKLVGLVYITTDDSIVFDRGINTFKRKIHLIPCNEDIKKYLFKTYNTLLYVKNCQQNPWVEVHGNFITSDTLETLPQFKFNFISFIDSYEDRAELDKKIFGE